MTSPHAPWSLTGECIVAWARGPGGRSDLPGDLHPLPGPCWLTAARFDQSPVGPYLEFAVGEPARLGARPGLCITTMVVDSTDSRAGGRVNWGFPKELGTLSWESRDEERIFHWEQRAISIRAVPSKPAVPVVFPMRALQRRADGMVVVPGRMWGRGRLSRVEVQVPADDPLASLAGSHRGILVSGLHLVVDPARHPAGLTATFRAPLRAPEPALSWGRQPSHPGD
ncbi:MAG: acetoacetate decarboxylase family protein [Acidimicrobiales bacterium]